MYNGWELRWRFIVFRPDDFKAEAYIILAVLFYVAFYWWGSSLNSARVKKWLSAHLPLYEQQFSKPNAKGLIQDGNSDFCVFSTGRRNIESLHTIFTLRPRHDFFQFLFQTARTLVELPYRPLDDLQLDFKLAPGTLNDNFVFAIVAKDELRSIKDSRWDLTFTKTTENPALPPTLSVMSEYADITENLLLKPVGTFNLAGALQDPKIQPFFRSLSITDQPRSRPASPQSPEKREKHLILSLRLPDSSDADKTLPLITSAFHLIDSLHKVALRPETRSKLKKTREELDRALKEEAGREKKEEEEEAKSAKKKKADEERMAKLSPVEQRKELEKEKKRQMRKVQKVVRK